jgi:phosphomannomutase
MPIMFSVSGLRGIAGQDLTPPLIRHYAKLFGHFHQARSIVIGRDCRPSGPAFRDAVIQGLEEIGVRVIDLGIAPTPTVCFMVRRLRAQAGIAITASHNPLQWNALKFITDRGEFPVQREFYSFLKFVKKNEPIPAARRSGTCLKQHRGTAVHIRRIIDHLGLSRLGLNVGVDAVCGTGSLAIPELLKRAGCRVHELNCTYAERFPRPPEPTPKHITGLCRLVKNKKLDLGFAVDPDSDRLSIVDDRGRAIGEELTLVLATDYVLGRKKGPAVTNLSTSALMDHVCKKHGRRLYRSRVGEANVVEMMKKYGAPIGGEGNGGVIFPTINACRDALTGIGLILKLVQTRRQALSDLVAEFPVYSMLKDTIILDKLVFEEKVEMLVRRFPGRVDRRDGLRISTPGWWLHIRPSNTEPIVRIIGESRSPAQIKQLIRSVKSLLSRD